MDLEDMGAIVVWTFLVIYTNSLFFIICTKYKWSKDNKY